MTSQYIEQLAGELRDAAAEQPITAPVEAATVLAEPGRLIDAALTAQSTAREEPS